MRRVSSLLERWEQTPLVACIDVRSLQTVYSCSKQRETTRNNANPYNTVMMLVHNNYRRMNTLALHICHHYAPFSVNTSSEGRIPVE